jgi:hypothetical protein
VHLARPLPLVGDEGERERARLSGFVQELAVRAADEPEARAIVTGHVASYDLGPEQQTEVIFIEIAEIEDGEAPVDARGVWFSTARSFYSEE